MSSIDEKIKKIKIRTGPLWAGPEGSGPNGGITQSLIGRWLECRERFRVRVIEGWRGSDQFQKALQYGQMWHACEEALAQWEPTNTKRGWEAALIEYCQGLNKKYPTQQEEIDHWYRTCKAQFPCYVDYWAKHPDVEQRTPLMQEQVFDVPYDLPSGRVVRLRGKFDSVDLIGKGKSAGIYLQENKTKGDVDEKRIKEQLHFDLQTMLYLIALTEMQRSFKEDARRQEEWDKVSPDWRKVNGYLMDDAVPILGVRYNVIRRPFSGGRGGIKRNPDKETKDQFYARLTGNYLKAEPEYWFMRWKSEVSPEDVKRFREECLDPLLEAICWWYDRQTNNSGIPSDHEPPDFHWRHPYGVHNYVDEGYGSDVDKYIETGSTVGLVRQETLFPELT